MRGLWSIVACLLCGTCALKLAYKVKKHGMLGEPAVNSSVVLPPDQWFNQKLDHFNPSDTRRWSQRYFTNDTFFYNDGPVFLMIGGEGTASPKWMVAGQWIELAMMYGALCFQVEHRYYGKSHPTKDSGVKNLAYLSSAQALADLAFFIQSMNDAKNLTSSKWIVFGGSYPGSLAAWMRIKYPHLVHGAVSSSGPLLAKADFKDFLVVVRESISTSTFYGEDCVRRIETATEEVKTAVEGNEAGDNLEEIFRLCDSLNKSNLNDVSNFYENLASNWAGIVQYNKDNREFEGSKGANITIDVACHIMTGDDNVRAILQYAELNSMLLDANGEKCLDFKYSKMIDDLRNTTWGNDEGGAERLWTYQTCTEFGFFQTSDAVNQPFGNKFPLGFFQKQCQDIFGTKFDAHFLNDAIQRTNIFYGGYNIDVRRVVFIHGSVDPWHALGITKSLSEDAPAIFINGTAHCADMYPSSEKDPPQLVGAREKIKDIIGKWLE